MLPLFLIISFFVVKHFEENITLLKGKKKLKILKFMVALILISSLIFLIIANIIIFSINSECRKENALLYSMDYIKNNSLLSEGDVIISNYWPYYAYYFNAKAYAISGSNLDEKIKEYSPKLFILKENDGTAYDAISIESSKNILLLQNFSDKCRNKIKIYTINFSTSSFS
jgi:hypothetical protein